MCAISSWSGWLGEGQSGQEILAVTRITVKGVSVYLFSSTHVLNIEMWKKREGNDDEVHVMIFQLGRCGSSTATKHHHNCYSHSGIAPS